jgi:hypothetical protein
MSRDRLICLEAKGFDGLDARIAAPISTGKTYFERGELSPNAISSV